MAKDEFSPDETIDSNETVKEEPHHAVHHKHHKHHAEHHEAHAKAALLNLWMVASIVLFAVAVLFLVLWLTKGGSAAEVGEDKVREDMKAYIDENLLQPGYSATIDSVKDIGGVYELTVTVQGQKITSYASKDGKIFFPSGMKIDEALPSTSGSPNQPAANAPKTETPEVEVFVMSHCPYGTQIEKGLLPVVELLGDKADIKVKFVDYAMHGQKEIDEQLNQYCIQQEYPDKFYKYLQCFLADSNGTRCIAENGISQSKLDACVEATDKEFGISRDYADKSTWRGSFPSFSIYSAENQKYGVQGSPTLVINGAQVSSGRDAESLKTAICNAFTNAPAECETELSNASPSAGFGFGTSGTDAAAAGCGV